MHQKNIYVYSLLYRDNKFGICYLQQPEKGWLKFWHKYSDTNFRNFTTNFVYEPAFRWNLHPKSLFLLLRKNKNLNHNKRFALDDLVLYCQKKNPVTIKKCNYFNSFLSIIFDAGHVFSPFFLVITTKKKK
jgi:hypothetical protein